MSTIRLQGREFTFFPPGLEGGEFQYRGATAGSAITFIRIGRIDLGTIGFDVPRGLEEKIGANDDSDLVRFAIGQALRDNLFNNHPDQTVYLDADAPRWGGNLDEVR